MAQKLGLKQLGLLAFIGIMAWDYFDLPYSFAEVIQVNESSAPVQLQIEQVQDMPSMQEVYRQESISILTPESTATTMPELTATATPEPTATATPEPTATATPEPTATATPEPTATATPEPTATATPEPTATATPEPTATATPELTATPEPTATATPEPTATATPEPAATTTPEPTATLIPAVEDGEVEKSQYAWMAEKTKIYQRSDASDDFLYGTLEQKAIVFVLDERSGWAKLAFVDAIADEIEYGYVQDSRLTYLSQMDADRQAEIAKSNPKHKTLNQNVYLLPVEVSYPEIKIEPTIAPTAEPTAAPTAEPTTAPTAEPTAAPTAEPTTAPTAEPTTAPTAEPTTAPTAEPTTAPTAEPTAAPTAEPTTAPTTEPTTAPTTEPTTAPTIEPTTEPTTAPTAEPTAKPSVEPTAEPTTEPSVEPTAAPTAEPTAEPSVTPSVEPDAPAEEEADQADVLSKAEWLEETHPNRSIEVVPDWGERPIELGVEVTLVAHIEGYEGLETQVFWQVNRGSGWETIDDSGNLSYTFTLNAENSQWQWRAGVTVLPVE